MLLDGAQGRVLKASRILKQDFAGYVSSADISQKTGRDRLFINANQSSHVEEFLNLMPHIELMNEQK